MEFIQHYSGSSGNLYEVVADNGKRLIIDPGVTWIKVQRALKFDIGDIEGCFCSHGHKDHCKALGAVRRAGIEIYASETTLKSAHVTGRRINVVEGRVLARLESFEVRCFDTIHDCDGSLGFVVREKATGEYLLFVTDTKCILPKFTLPFNIIAIECSYNGEYLAKRVREETINETLAKRLLNSHLEETECLRYLQEFCDLSQCREVHLLHMSADNLNKERIKEGFNQSLFLQVRTV